MIFGSLFAGIGGMDLGLERVGMTCAWQVEIDDFCQKVLTKHWPDVPKYGDIRDVGKENLKSVDLIAGGFPCQPFSVAGKRRGSEDDRHLWPEMLRVISELKPAWVLGENVPGIIPLFLDQAISDLEAEGYKCTPIVFPACAFDAPHRRDRLFIIAYDEGNLRGTSRDARPISPDRGNSHLADPDRNGRVWRGQQSWNSDTNGSITREIQEGGNKQDKRNKITKSNSSGEIVADTERIHAQGCENGQRKREFRRGSRWLPEPNVGRVAHGVPNRVDRLKSLGNAVVPQVAEFIGRIIIGAIE